MKLSFQAIISLASCYSLHVFSAGVPGEIEQMLVTDEGVEHVSSGEAESASVGTVLAHQIEHRPLLRPAEILETVPGMVVTQHSGGGKANQYFLRGFNLDHSTDFATYFEGAPVNMVTHGHGQGYSDLNFLVPELVDRMVYKKGPYYATEGDFSSVGSSRIEYFNEREGHHIKLTGGEDGYRRGLVFGGINHASHHWVYAVSHTRDDGPWTNPDELERDHGFLKYSGGDKNHGFSLSGLYFDSSWNGTDQIPRRLIDGGELSRFGTLDNSTGGETHRYQLSYAHWADVGDGGRIRGNAYVVDYELSLTGNFTYYSGDIASVSPVAGVLAGDIADQVTQFDDRKMFGGRLVWEQTVNADHQWLTGADVRHDRIDDVGVGPSFRREIYEFSSHATVDETAFGVFSRVHSQWNDWFASSVGVRYDRMEVDVTDRLSADNSGDGDADLVSPKVSLRFGPWQQTELFLNYGQGFHSNDARGVVADVVPLMSESEGYEVGLRSTPFEGLQVSAVWFELALDSELVFVGDDGTTEPKDATERQGLELSAYYQPKSWLVVDADYTHSMARFKETQFDGDELLGDHVPDSIEDVFSVGVSLDHDSGVHAGLRLRYFGPRNLTEDGSRRSSSSQMVNANIGYTFDFGLALGLEVLNLTDREDDDITYWYGSRTQEERDNGVEPVEDFHVHPMIPRTVRATVSWEF